MHPSWFVYRVLCALGVSAMRFCSEVTIAKPTQTGKAGRSVPGSWFLVPGSWFLVLSSWFLVLSSRFSVPGSRFLVLGSQFSVLSSQFSVLSSRFLVLSSRFSVLGSQFSVLSSWFSVLGSWFLVLAPPPVFARSDRGAPAPRAATPGHRFPGNEHGRAPPR
jgi:hypothetical protein